MNGHVHLIVKVAAGSHHDAITGWLGQTLKVQVAASPVKGRANEAVIRLLARTIGLGCGQITIARGHTKAIKTVRIAGLNSGQIRARLAEAAG